MKKIEHAYLIDDNEFVLMISEKIIRNHTALEKITSFTNGQLALNTIIKTIKNKGQLFKEIQSNLQLWEHLKKRLQI